MDLGEKAKDCKGPEDKEVEFWSPVNELASNKIYLQGNFVTTLFTLES